MAHRSIKLAALALPIATLTFGVALASGPASRSRVDPGERIQTPAGATPTTPSASAKVAPEDVAAAQDRGAAWLESIQKDDGGWGAGDWSTDSVEAPSDVATTSLVVLALIRDADGGDAHHDAIVRGIRYVAGVVDRSPDEGARLAVVEGTQPQYKLGQLVDTHLAALMLGEVAGTLDERNNRMVALAHGKVITKVQQAQNEDGSFDTNGWAPVLSSSIAASSLDRAVQLGVEVDGEVLARNDRYQQSKIDRDGNLDTSSGAGVDLYAAATTLRGNAESKRRLPASSTRAAEATEAQAAAQARISSDSSGALFSGFGSVGGEEMLSYMMISDTLADEGGDDWDSWNGRVGAYLVGIQNADGSWAGHHCITSRTFTTAAAMMTLGSADAARSRAARITGQPATRRASATGFAPEQTP